MSPQSNLQNMKQRFKDKFVSPWMVDDGADNMLWNKKAPTPNEILVFISQELQKAREERDEEINNIKAKLELDLEETENEYHKQFPPRGVGSKSIHRTMGQLEMRLGLRIAILKDVLDSLSNKEK